MKTQNGKLPALALALAILGFNLTAIRSAKADVIIPKNPVIIERNDGFTATMLPNGKVLIAGGFNQSNSALSSVELYNPATKKCSMTGAMTTERWSHTATLLPNGKVLVAGGYNSNNVTISSAELYDPITGKWTATGAMTTNRSTHTATLLSNGKVLIAGGNNRSLGNDGGSIPGAELYDPVTGKWTATGDLKTQRESHTATLLTNGLVLVAGGRDSTIKVLASAELYDAATGKWTATGDMKTERWRHTATLLTNGLVLVTGGTEVLPSEELYNPVTRKWTWSPANSIPITVSITSPTDNASFDTAWVNVCGTFTGVTVKQILVNGVLAFIRGNTFEAVDVPFLQAGTNTITAFAQDAGDMNLQQVLSHLDEITNKASVNVIAVSHANEAPNLPVQVQVTPSAGFAPVPVTFKVQAHVPGKIQKVFYDFDGDHVPDLTNTDLQPVTHTFNTAGQYFFIVTVQTDIGRFSNPFGLLAMMATGSGGDSVTWYANVQAPPVLLSTLKVTDPVDIKWTATSNLYVLSGSTATITEFDANERTVRSSKGIGSNPSGFDVDTDGNVYVAMTGKNQVWKFRPTADSFEADGKFGNGGFIGNKDGSAGSSSNQFNAPFCVAVSPDGQGIVVSDSGNHRIQNLTKGGTFTGSSGKKGDGLGQFNHPRGLAFGNGVEQFLFVVDSDNNRIVVDNGTSGTNGTAPGQFQGALNLCSGSRGVYVADTGNNRVQLFAPVSHGEMHSATPFWPRISLSQEVGLNHPKAVAAVEDPVAEKIYIADTGNNRVILVNLPLNGPENVWNDMKAHLATGDIQGALFDFSMEFKDVFRATFLPLEKSEFVSYVKGLGPLQPVTIGNEEAVYSYKDLDDEKTYTVNFIKENGVWKINRL